MKLFLKEGACSLASHIALEEAGLRYDTESVDLRTRTLASGGDFVKINPKGYVPALLLSSGELLTEGPAILQYVADQAPSKGLAPAAGTLARYQLQSWLTFIGTELHKNFSAFFDPAARDDWKGVARRNLESRFGFVNEHLAAQPFLLGEAFSVADAYLFTVLNWAGAAQLDLSARPALAAFQQRVGARPAVQSVMKAEGLLG